ncbi:hypothetical protein [Kitasatospora phosalacinea]|uniref:Uncharacterized protein n=1 Tax=Kitasatospora phosalacinea TaxID=2065 RepID=A0A9W6PE54_9ACTN|nr:hypothetical protein [Kitasatospora phosalacinea]GLW53287.1 hypothetical protein Kpho01_12980 [Kitasatospora phosalacinea]
MPDTQGMAAFDAKGFSELPSLTQPGASRLIAELVDESFIEAGLQQVLDERSFTAPRGDGLAMGFPPKYLPAVIDWFVPLLDRAAAAYNACRRDAPVRLRMSLHLGPVTIDGNPPDANGAARNDLHRLLDSEPLKRVLDASDPEVTHLVSVFSDRVYQDVLVGGYSKLRPGACTRVEATVSGKAAFHQTAWLYIPSPSGGATTNPAARPGAGGAPDGPWRFPRRPRLSQTVGNGTAVAGDVYGGLTIVHRP